MPQANLILKSVKPLKLKWKGEGWEEGKPMTVRQPRYSKEEFARLGDEIYNSHVWSLIEAGNHDLIVAIDIKTGAWEMDANENE